MNEVKKKILVVDDEVRLRENICELLDLNGFLTAAAENGQQAEQQVREFQPDLVICDIRMPLMDGYEFLQRLRENTERKDIPLIFISAKVERDDIRKGMNLGADDYLTKPFAFTELMARIQALLRRAAPLREDATEPTVLRLGDLEVDLLRRKATRAGRRLDLTAKEFNLLALLLRRQGEVLSRTELAAQVWDMNFDSETNVVEVAVRRLRGKLDASFDHVLLHTVRGMGYVLEART